jgi:cytochrome c biogenesis protein CcmG/thiol:disulfide interchange protein DsbE
VQDFHHGLPGAADGIIEAIVLRGKIVSTLLVSLAFGACSCSRPPRKVAPNFALNDSDGRTVQLADYRGKVVLLNFWATWCDPCRIEIPWFTEFERKHKDRGFAVVGISMDEEGWDAVKPFISEYRINYRVLMGNNEVAQLYDGVEALPTTFLIDREGKIAAIHEGLVSKSRYERDLNQLLDSPQGAAGTRGASRPTLLARTK